MRIQTTHPYIKITNLELNKIMGMFVLNIFTSFNYSNNKLWIYFCVHTIQSSPNLFISKHPTNPRAFGQTSYNIAQTFNLVAEEGKITILDAKKKCAFNSFD